MMQSKFTRLMVIVTSLLTTAVCLNLAEAREGYWQGDVSTELEPGRQLVCGGAPAMVGSCRSLPAGLTSGRSLAPIAPTERLNTTARQFAGDLRHATGCEGHDRRPVSRPPRVGLSRVNPSRFVNPAPAAGALVGKLTISGGTLNNVSTGESGIGADGRIVVGADGRGFLTMTGGTLTGQQLVVGGENFTGDALGTSMVDLSGSASLAIQQRQSHQRNRGLRPPIENHRTARQAHDQWHGHLRLRPAASPP